MLLAVAAWRNLHQLNPDAIAYCRIAGYYAGGQWELGVTGYWGPLLSWLMVPLLKVGCAPLVAARVVMAVSGAVFLAGAVNFFRAFRLPPMATLAGACIATGWSVFWSVRNISPDLLLAGLVGLAVAATVEGCLFGRRSTLIAAGMWWGVAYLAKAVALPLAVLATAGCAVFAAIDRPDRRRELAARLGVVWVCLAVVAGPWIAALSVHYGQFTFSTTGPVAHALAGPGEQSRYHPAMVTLHQPDAGRVTQWEEPSRMAYRRWSPFASGENLRHQLGVMADNTGTIFGWLAPWAAWFDSANLPAWRRWLGAFDLLGLGAVAVLVVAGGTVLGWPHARTRRWRAGLLPVVLLGGLYLPFFVMAEDNRYFYPVWPCLWVLGLAALPRHQRGRRTGFRVLLWSFAIPAVLWCGAALRGLPNPAAEAAWNLAGRLQQNGWTGAVAGSGLLPGGRTGLYTAFFLGERWLGDDAGAEPEEFTTAGARVVVLRRDSPLRKVFERTTGWMAVEPAASIPLILFVWEKP